MKKILLLLIGISAATISCEDDIVNYELSLIRGDWKMEKTVISSGKYPTEILETQIPNGCTAQNTYTFGTNDEFIQTQYIGTTNNCIAGESLEGTFSYNSDERVLTFNTPDIGQQDFKVLVLTSNQIICQYLGETDDIDLDEVPEIHTVYFKR